MTGSRRRFSANAGGTLCIATIRNESPSLNSSVPNLASLSRVAFSSMAWNTGSSSPGELEMTPSTSDVAVCCSSDSFSFFSRSRACASSFVITWDSSDETTHVFAFVLLERSLRPRVWSFAPLRDKVTSSTQSLVPFRSGPAEIVNPNRTARSMPAASFDHLIGTGEQRRRNVETDGLRRGEVDHQIELRRHLDRKVSRLRALENPTDVDAGATMGIGQAGSVAHQAADLGVIARCIARQQCVADRQRDELAASVVEDRTTADEQRAGSPLHDRCKGGIELGFTCRLHDQDLPPDGAPCRLQVSQLNFELR